MMTNLEKFRIKPTVNQLGSPCSRCGFLAYRIPFEIVDQDNKPLCMSCARKHTFPLYKGLAAYHSCITSNILEYKTKDHCYYVRYGCTRNREEAREIYYPFIKHLIQKVMQLDVKCFLWMLTENNKSTIRRELNAPDAKEARINKIIQQSFASFEPLKSDLRYLLFSEQYEMISNIDQPSTRINDIPFSDTITITSAMNEKFIGYIGLREKSGELANIEQQGAFVCESEYALTCAIINWCNYPETFEVQRVNFSSILQMFRRKIPCAFDRKSFERFKDVFINGSNLFTLPSFESAEHDGFAIVALSLHDRKD